MASERPINVPLDWIEVDCANDKCPYTVWVPPDLDEAAGPETRLMNVCSAECAMVVTKSILG